MPKSTGYVRNRTNTTLTFHARAEEQRCKILKWIDDGDIIGVFPYATGLPRLVLTNQTKLDKWNRKKKRQ